MPSQIKIARPFKSVVPEVMTAADRALLRREHRKYRREMDKTNDLIASGKIKYHPSRIGWDHSQRGVAVELNRPDNMIMAGEL